MMRIPPAADAAHANQVVGGKAQQRLPRELGLTDQLGLGQTAHCLGPAKGLLDALAHLQAGFVAIVPLDARPSTSECSSLAAPCGVTLSFAAGLEQHLWRHRRTATAGVHRLELAVHCCQQRINHSAQFAQRLCLRHALFKADVADHRPLEIWVASHLSCLGRSWVA